MDVPSRRALDAVDAHNRASDAGLRGYLSEARGFLPPRPPVTALPPTHAPWDEVAAELPARFRDVTVRDALRDLPLLDAGGDALADEHVRRATTVLGILAHSWFRSDVADAGPLPDAVARPWRQVCDRLGRPTAFLEFEDITTANYRLLDPAGAMLVENLDLLVPTVGNDAERFFMMALVELAARSTPMIGATVRAQEHMAAGDHDGLEAELALLLRTVRDLADGLVKADPNPYSRTYVDPVVWGVTVAPFAVSVNPDAPSPGGTAAPLFQVLDAFLGRRAYGSLLGQEVRRIHDVSPSLHRQFVGAVTERPLAPYLAEHGTPTLRGLARALLEAYAGEQGLLQLHRVKAYGYLEVAFKVGRPVTLSGFEGLFRERPWKRVDEALDASMRERAVDAVGEGVPQAALLTRAPAATDAPVQSLVLDIADQGVVYDPGDRVAVLPENGPGPIGRVLDLLGAAGSTEVRLTAAWRESLARRGVDPVPDRLPLHDLLRWAKLRPLPRATAKALLAISGAAALGAVVEARLEDQLELADALAMVAAAGYDVGRLLRAEPWQPESFAAIVPMEGERLYSVSSAPTSKGCQATLALTVGDVAYDAVDTAGAGRARREGVGSHWLNRHLAAGRRALPFRVVRPRRFQLPDDPSTPIVLFAGGTGLSPFLGFLEARAATPGSGSNLLFYGARRAADVLHRDRLDAWVASGDLELHVALSRDDVAPRRVADLVAEQADRLRDLVGAGGAVVYVCGQAGFALGVVDALERIGDVRRLAGEQRLRLDVFTTNRPVRSAGPLGDRTVPASELVTRNDDGAGYWLAIDGAVYDVTGFRHLHPGGIQILDESAGTDASTEYRAVLHHLDGEVDALLAMYKVGLVRRLRFGSRWGLAVTPAGLADVTLADLYRAWARYAYLTVEMQNALRNDWLYRPLPLTRGERVPLTTQKLMLLANTHDRWVAQYLLGSTADDLVDLWRLATGLGQPSAPIAELPRALDEVHASPDATRAAAVAARLRGLYVESRRRAAGDRFWVEMDDLWWRVNAVHERYLADLKATLRQGLLLFEEHEEHVLDRAGPELVDRLRAIPGIVADAYRGVGTLVPDPST